MKSLVVGFSNSLNPLRVEGCIYYQTPVSQCPLYTPEDSSLPGREDGSLLWGTILGAVPLGISIRRYMGN